MSVLARQRGVVQAMTTAAVMLTLGLAGCADDPEIEWPDDPSPGEPIPAASPASPAEAAAIEELLALVDDFRDAEAASYADPQRPYVVRRELGGFLADPLLSRTVNTLSELERAGIAYEGRPAWDPAVSELRLDATPPTATVRDCVDASNWRSVFQETGDPVPGEELPDHYVMRLEATRFDEGWLFDNGGIEEGTQC